MSEQRFEDILDECINRMLGGESWQQVIAAYPQHAAALLPALQGADAASRLQWSAPSASSRAAAQRNMMNEVAGTGSATANAAKGGVVMGVTQWFRKRPPVARVAAVGAAAVMFGAVTMGAAAATGNAPQPVRNLFGVSDSVIRVEFTGTIVSIEGLRLTVDANGDLRTVVVSDATRFGDDDDDARSIADFATGDLVEVEGRLQPDNTVLASELRLEDDDDGIDATETAEVDDDDFTATPEPADEPDDDPTPSATEDDANEDDDDDCDNSGPGSPCDYDDDAQGEDENENHNCDDSSADGPCNDDDDPKPSATEDDASDDDEADDDNSGSGSGSDDEPDDDSSGSGSSSDDEPDDD